jgi:O-antigen ligase
VAAHLRQQLRRWLVPVAAGAGALTLVVVAVVPFTGVLGGTATAALLVLGLLLGLLVLSARDGCSILTWALVLLFLVPQPYVLVGPLKSIGNPATLVALAGLAIWAASRVLNLSQASELNPVRWVLLVFTIAATAAYAAGMVRDLTASESASTTRVIFGHMALLGVALLAVDELGTRERITVLLQRVVLLGGVAASIGILEFAFSGFDFREVMRLPGLTANVDPESVSRSGFDRITSGSSHPIEFAVVTAALVPLALHFVIHTRTGRWPYALALVAMLAAIPMSVSRSGFLALAVGFLVYAAALSHRGRLNALVLGLIGVAVFRAMVPGLLGTVRSLFRDTSTDPSIAGRTDDYAAIPGLMDGHWWWGRGLGTFVPDVYFFLDNQFLAALLQGGVIGLLAFIVLLLVGIGTARGVRRRATDPALRSLGQALAATIASLGVSGFVFDLLSFRQSGFLLFLAIGCAGALWSLVRHEPKEQHRPAPDPAPEEERWPSPVS